MEIGEKVVTNSSVSYRWIILDTRDGKGRMKDFLCEELNSYYRPAYKRPFNKYNIDIKRRRYIQRLKERVEELIGDTSW